MDNSPGTEHARDRNKQRPIHSQPNESRQRHTGANNARSHRIVVFRATALTAYIVLAKINIKHKAVEHRAKRPNNEADCATKQKNAHQVTPEHVDDWYGF